MANHPEAIADLYERFTPERYAELAADPNAYPLGPVLADVLSRYQVKQSGGRVVDIGCGPGLLKEYSHYAYYAGIDLSVSMLQAAAGRGYDDLAEGPVLPCLSCFPDASFDSAIAFSLAYFLDPDELKELVNEMDRLASDFWLLTLDGIPDKLRTEYGRHGVELYDHVGCEVPGISERFTVPGWRSATGEGRLPMEIVVKKK